MLFRSTSYSSQLRQGSMAIASDQAEARDELRVEGGVNSSPSSAQVPCAAWTHEPVPRAARMTRVLSVEVDLRAQVRLVLGAPGPSVHEPHIGLPAARAAAEECLVVVAVTRPHRPGSGRLVSKI